ncbi:MAG: hypothetical protein ABR548_04830 [Actinomycetota bacterium]
MPRRNRRAPEDRSESPRPKGLVPSRSGYQVRESTAQKEYRCPGCNQEIRPGTVHVVAWRDEDAADRRHWHTPCWRRSGR